VKQEPDIEQHYTGKQVAALLAVCPETVRRLAAKGELPSVRVGSDRRYPRSGLLDYLRRRREAEA
jgi:excisionase family DNA binding protein